jgi:hypothetical protein
MSLSPSSSAPTPDPRLERALRQLVAIGAVLSLVLLRVDSPWFGALPLWLLGMPLVSWWALHRFRLPRLSRAAAGNPRRRRHPTTQARRRLPTPATRRMRAA